MLNFENIRGMEYRNDQTPVFAGENEIAHCTAEEDGIARTKFKGVSISDRRGVSITDYLGTAISGEKGTSCSTQNGTSISGIFGRSISAESGYSKSGNFGISFSENNGMSISGDYGFAISGEGGISKCGRRGLAFSGGKAYGSYNSLCVARGEEGSVKVQGKMDSFLVLIVEPISEEKSVEYGIARVDGKIIKEDVWYTLENGKFVEVFEESDP